MKNSGRSGVRSAIDLAGLVVSVVGVFFALYLMYSGLAFAGISVWDYNDSQPGFYIVVGSVTAVVGAGVLLAVTTLGLRLLAHYLAGTARWTSRPTRSALGITLVAVAVACLIFFVEILFATPDSTSRIDVSMLAAGVLGVSLISGGLAVPCFRD